MVQGSGSGGTTLADARGRFECGTVAFVCIMRFGGRVKWSYKKYVGRNIRPEETEQVPPSNIVEKYVRKRSNRLIIISYYENSMISAYKVAINLP